MKIINVLLLIVTTCSLFSCSKEDLSSQNNSTSSINEEVELLDYLPLIDNAFMFYGIGFSAISIIYNDSAEVTPLNDFLKDLKFAKYGESRSEMPFAESLNVMSNIMSDSLNVHYEITNQGEVYFRNFKMGNEFYIATTKVDYIEFFDLFYADSYPLIAIGKNAR